MKNSLIQDLRDSLRLGTESFETIPNNEEVSATEFIPEGETATAQDLDSIEDAEAIEEITDTVDGNLEASDSVDELAVAVEHAKNSNRPMNRFEAASLSLAFHQVTRKHYKDPLSMLPAREAHQSTNVTDLVLVHESLKETAGDLFKKAVDTIKEIIKKLVEFVRGVINKYGALARRFGNIHKAARALTTSPEGQVSVNSKAFEINGTLTLEAILALPATIGEIYDNTTRVGDWLGVNEFDTIKDESTYRALIQKLNQKSITDVKDSGKVIKNNGQAPSDIGDYVALAGNKYLGTKKLGESELLSVKLGDLSVKSNNDVEDAEYTDTDGKHVKPDGKRSGDKLVEAPGKDIIVNSTKECFDLIVLIKRLGSKSSRDIDVKFNFSKLHHGMGGKEQFDESDKKNVKLMTQYVASQSSLLRDVNSWAFDRLVGLATFFEHAIKSTTLGDQGDGSDNMRDVKEEPKA